MTRNNYDTSRHGFVWRDTDFLCHATAWHEATLWYGINKPTTLTESYWPMSHKPQEGRTTPRSRRSKKNTQKMANSTSDIDKNTWDIGISSNITAAWAVDREFVIFFWTWWAQKFDKIRPISIKSAPETYIFRSGMNKNLDSDKVSASNSKITSKKGPKNYPKIRRPQSTSHETLLKPFKIKDLGLLTHFP